MIVLIIATFFRLYNLNTTPPGFYPDEAINANNAIASFESGEYSVFYPDNNGREGLYIILQALSFGTFGVHEAWVFRVVSALFGIGTIAGLFFLVRKIFAKHPLADWIAFASSFLLALSVWHIIFSRIGFRAIMAPFFLVWALYFLVETYANTARTYAPWIYATAGGLLYGLGMHSYIAYRATPLIIIVAMFALQKVYNISWKRSLTLLAVFVVASIVAFSPLGLHFIQHPQDFFGRTSQVSVFNSPTPLQDIGTNTLQTLGMLNIRGDGNWRHNISGEPQLHWFAGILFLVGLVLSVWASRKKIADVAEHASAYWLAFILGIAWIVVGLLPVVISNEGIPHALRAILIIPPLFMFAGIALVHIGKCAERCMTRETLVTVCWAIGALLLINTFTSYYMEWGQHPNVADAFSVPYKEVALDINSTTRGPLDAYVVVNAGGVLVDGIPMPAQTVMFFTDTATKEKQEQKGVHYLLPEQTSDIPEGVTTFFLEPSPSLSQ
jgi:hypothetical protein